MTAQYRVGGRRATEIAASVEAGVRAGGLPAGATLPPVRALASELAVSPNTVAAAYRLLRERGAVETDGRRGTRVRARPATAPRAADRLPVPEGAVDLSRGEPDPALLPDLRPVLRRIDPGQVGYDAGTLPRLAGLAAARLAAGGVPADALTVTAGALDGIERCLLARLAPGDRVAVEDPGWSNLLDLVGALDLRPVAVGVDDDGMRPEPLAAALRGGARAVVVTARAHNPTGASVTSDRAAALREVLVGHPDVLVIEDDHAAELAEAPLATLAGGASWAHVRSASKPYGPDLRLAVLAGDPVTVARVEGRRRLGAGWVSHLSQALVAELWSDPVVEATVARGRREYARRRHGLRAALAARGVHSSGREGLNVWVPVADETTAVIRLRDAGLVVAPGARYRLASPPAIRITVSPLREDDVDGVADAVAAAVRPGGGRRGA